MNQPPTTTPELQTKMDEYLREYRHGAYEFIYFKDKGRLCGSFFEYYGLLEYSHDTEDVKCMSKMLNDCYDSILLNPQCLPECIRKTIMESKDKFYCDDNFEQFAKYDIKLPDWADESTLRYYKYDSDEVLSSMDLVRAMELIGNMDNSHELYTEYYNNVDVMYKEEYYEEISKWTCIERPVQVTLSGTDDLMYSKNVATVDDAKRIAEILHERGCKDEFHVIMDDLGFYCD